VYVVNVFAGYAQVIAERRCVRLRGAQVALGDDRYLFLEIFE
jgi:hypothetical protein